MEGYDLERQLEAGSFKIRSRTGAGNKTISTNFPSFCVYSEFSNRMLPVPVSVVERRSESPRGLSQNAIHFPDQMIPHFLLLLSWFSLCHKAAIWLLFSFSHLCCAILFVGSRYNCLIRVLSLSCSLNWWASYTNEDHYHTKHRLGGTGIFSITPPTGAGKD